MITAIRFLLVWIFTVVILFLACILSLLTWDWSWGYDDYLTDIIGEENLKIARLSSKIRPE